MMETIFTVVLVVLAYGGALVKIIIDGINRDEERASRNPAYGLHREWIDQEDWDDLARAHFRLIRSRKSYKDDAKYVVEVTKRFDPDVRIYPSEILLMVLEYRRSKQ